ncbi:hypothetical protein [Clostridium sp. Marseille-QA1073]
MLKNKIIVGLIIGLSVTFSLTGCSSKDNKSQENTKIENKENENLNIEDNKKDELTKNKISNKSNENSTSNRYEVAGIMDVNEFEEAFKTVQKLVKDNDKSSIAEYIIYPINANINGNKIAINSKEDFINNYDKIFNEKVRKTLIDQKVEDTFVSNRGVMVGSGELYFIPSNETGHKYGIYAINN